MTVVERLARLVDRLPERRVLVAVDGPDAAGKTALACALAAAVVRPVVCASVDGWHQPRAARHRRGDASGEGYYLDSFDLAALERELLTPFRSGARRVRVAAFDHRRDAEVHDERPVPPDAALLVDGVFLLRPELARHWDLRVYLHVPEQVTLARAVLRDREELGGEAAVCRRYRERYLPGQALYRERVRPQELADVVLDGSGGGAPTVLRWPDV